MRGFLFISGPARSGTTALARVVNSHGRIAIGMERFKQIMFDRTLHQFQPSLFEEARFFNFDDGHTNMTPAKSDAMDLYYSDIKGKFPELTYIGDKVPNTSWVARRIHRKFPRSKYLFIVRDIRDTACSWQKRAEDPNDPWASSKGGTACINAWNNTNRTYLQLSALFPDDFYMVDFHAFFDGPTEDKSALNRLCHFLGVEADQSMIEAYRQARTVYSSRVKNKPRQLTAAQLETLRCKADFEAYENATGRRCDIDDCQAH